ncbi:MAG: cell wall hydrolase [Firmicutes bacterium]|nr:cell wall hydrolase [Bacillota bacterium]
MFKLPMALSVCAAALVGSMAVPAFAATNNVTVQPGNTMWSISQAQGISVQALEQANPSINPNDMLIGTVLNLPGSTSAPQASPAVSSTAQQNLYWMEHVINAEAGGESLNAQIAVGDVIMHRLQAGGYGSTVHDVVFQVIAGHYQFSSVQNGYIYSAPDASSIQAAEDVLWYGKDVAPGAMVFYNPTMTPSNSWVRAQPYLSTFDNLVFAR